MNNGLNGSLQCDRCSQKRIPWLSSFKFLSVPCSGSTATGLGQSHCSYQPCFSQWSTSSACCLVLSFPAPNRWQRTLASSCWTFQSWWDRHFPQESVESKTELKVSEIWAFVQEASKKTTCVKRQLVHVFTACSAATGCKKCCRFKLEPGWQ